MLHVFPGETFLHRFFLWEWNLKILILININICWNDADSRYPFREAVVQRCSVKEVFLEISQNSQENTCARASFLIKLKAWGLQLYYKRDPGTGVFLQILQNFTEYLFTKSTPLVAASAFTLIIWAYHLEIYHLPNIYSSLPRRLFP